MHTRWLTGFAVMVLLAVAPLWSAQPAVGEKAPDFTLHTLEGQSVTLSKSLGMGKTVLVLLRGFPGYQCPLCNRQAQDFIKNAPTFREAEAQVIMVYPGAAADLGKRAKEFMDGKNFPTNFQLLLDPDYEFTNLYGLRWNADKETSYPSTFILDRNGVITFAKISRSHGDRTSASQVLELLQR